MAWPQRLSGLLESFTSPPAPQDAPDIDAIAESINKSGMSGVASILLHAAKPLSWLGGQMLWALQPFAGVFGNKRGHLSVGGVALLLEQEGFADDLAERLN